VPVRILSIDGGGIRGIIPATILVALEDMAGRSIFELFDGIVGTSTGGILALGLTCPQVNGRPRSAVSVRSLYLDRGETIFPLSDVGFFSPPKTYRDALWGTRAPLAPGATAGERAKSALGWGNIARVFSGTGGGKKQGNARYPVGPLEAELDQQFGDARMSQALRPVAVVSCDLARSEHLLFCGGGLPQGDLGDPSMRVVARATSAAPTFFREQPLRDLQGRDRQCVDGGLVANDPSIVGYMVAEMLGATNQGGVVLISLGTGKAPVPEGEDIAQITINAPWWKLASPVVKSIWGTPGDLHRQLLTNLSHVNYIRVQPPLGFGALAAMDRATRDNIDALKRTGEDFVSKRRDTLIGILAALGSR